MFLVSRVLSFRLEKQTSKNVGDTTFKVNLEIQTLQSGKVFLANAFKDKNLSYTVLDVSLTVLFLPICNIILYFWQSKLAFLISLCSCCYISSDKLLLFHWLLTSSLTVSQFWKFSIICFVKMSEAAAVDFSFATFNCFLFWAIENLLELIVSSLTLLAFSEVLLICKPLQEKFVLLHFVVTPFNKFIKLSKNFCCPIPSLKNWFLLVGTYPNSRLTCSNEYSQFSLAFARFWSLNHVKNSQSFEGKKKI